MTFYQIVFLFFAYSFLGWVGEVLFTAVVHRKYQDRGVPVSYTHLRRVLVRSLQGQARARLGGPVRH